MKKRLIVLFVLLSLQLIIKFSLTSAQPNNLQTYNEKLDPSLISHINNVTSKIIPSSTTSYEEIKIPVIVLLQENEKPEIFISKLLSSKKIDSKFVTFSWINGFATQLSSNEIKDLSLMPEVKKVYLDKKINITSSILAQLEKSIEFLNLSQYNTENEEENLNESAHQIGADYFWELGVKGEGVKVAVLDTGIDKNHPALKGKVILEKDLTWWDDKLDANDYYGHGTHVAGIIAGYYVNGTLNVSKTNTTYFKVVREIITSENSLATVIYRIEVEGPYPPLGMFADEKYKPGSNHVKFYDKDKTPIELYTYNNQTCDVNVNCSSVPEPSFTTVIVNNTLLTPSQNFTNPSTNSTIKFIEKNNVSVTSFIIYEQPLGVINGVAPNASLMNFKVLGDYGWGLESSVIKGIELATENGAQIISMSLGGWGHPDDIVSRVLDKAVERGVVVVVAAGNSGFSLFSIGSPGTAREALTIGCVDKENQPCWFTSWGPLISGEIKPDIVAPGYEIISACAENSVIGQWYGCNYTQGKLFVPLSGTSMSTPHVAGLVALLLNAKNALKPAEIKSLLVQNVVNQTIIPLPIIVGSGVVNGTEAYLSLEKYGLVFSPSNLFFGYIYNNEDNNITLHIKNLLNTSKSYSLKYYAGWPDETFTDLVYSESDSIVISPNEEKTLILFINSTRVKELQNVTDFINFIPFYVYVEINGTKNYTFPTSVILPEKLNITYIDGYSASYSKNEELNLEGNKAILGKWYWMNVYNGTEYIWFENYLSNSEDNSWGFATFGVVDPENRVKEKEWDWLYYHEYEYPSVKPGKWKIVAFAIGDNSFVRISANKPILFINWTYAEGTPGDSFIWRKEIKNLIEEPLNITIGKRIDSYISDRVLNEKSDTILYPSGVGYYEFNISNYTEGIKFEFDFSNNTLVGCYEFLLYLFNPEGILNDTGFIGFCNYYPYFVVVSPYQLSPPTGGGWGWWMEGSGFIEGYLKPEKGTWTLIVVPHYNWWYENEEKNINLTVKMKDLMKENAWSQPLTTITLSGGEDSALEFNITIPKNVTSWSYHQDIYEMNISIPHLICILLPEGKCSANRVIYVSINVRPFYFTINVTNLPQLINNKGVKYFLVNSTETLPLAVQLFGYNNTPKESYSNFTFVKVLKFFNETWVDWEGEVHSYVYPLLDYENRFTTNYYYINGSDLINLTLPSWISQGYWALYGMENKTNGYSNEIYLFVISPIIDIQTSPNTTLPLNFSSVGVYLEPYFNSSSAGKIFVEEVNITIPTSLAKLKAIHVELEENLRNILGWSILRLYYDPNVVSSRHINENSLAIYYYNENVEAWEKISSSINKMDHYVEANVTHFSVYGLLGEISPYCGDGVCNNGETYSSCPQDCPAPSPTPTPGPTGGGGAPLVSAACEENWSCSSWSECYPNGTQYRICKDLSSCGTTKNKPEEIRSCIYTAPAKVPICGNNICETDLGENQTSCCLDCRCPTGYECKDNVCVEIIPPKEKVTPTPSPLAGFIVLVTSPVGIATILSAIVIFGFILLVYWKLKKK